MELALNPTLPRRAALAHLAGLPAGASMDDAVASTPVQAWLQDLVNRLAQAGTGSANRIARAALMAEPPQIDRGEVTDKGSINQRAVLKHRAAQAEALHAGTLPFIALAQGDKK